MRGSAAPPSVASLFGGRRFSGLDGGLGGGDLLLTLGGELFLRLGLGSLLGGAGSLLHGVGDRSFRGLRTGGLGDLLALGGGGGLLLGRTGAASITLGLLLVLALLALGFRNIRLGPTLPAFLSPAVARTLAECFGLCGVGTAEDDVKAIML